MTYFVYLLSHFTIFCNFVGKKNKMLDITSGLEYYQGSWTTQHTKSKPNKPHYGLAWSHNVFKLAVKNEENEQHLGLV